MNRKTCETVNASIVEAIPKSTSSVIHPDALRVDAEDAALADISADYRGPSTSRFACAAHGRCETLVSPGASCGAGTRRVRWLRSRKRHRLRAHSRVSLSHAPLPRPAPRCPPRQQQTGHPEEPFPTFSRVNG